MKFSRLRIAGFKTFVEPTEFLIENGLTGIVGPNGCGKSNLVEALRWAMGESSYKAMRAADMEDVIFSGSTSRPSRNVAEVTITVDNDDKSAPAGFNGYDTLEVSRKIERDKGSTYRVNGREVRARDVQLLFADASSGARSPALVRQGMIGELVSAKPQARRRILEEAAGVSGLHARRAEAEIRLRAAEQNLERVEDVLNRLVEQIESLKKQAKQAVRYRGLSHDIRRTEATLLHVRFLAAEEDIREAARTIDASVVAVANATAAANEAATRQAVAAHEVPALRDSEAAAAAALTRLEVARDGLERDEKRAQDRIAALARTLQTLAADAARETALAGDADGVLARLATEEQTLTEARAGATDSARSAEARLADTQAVLARAEKAFGEATQALANATARRTQAERALRDAGERLVKLEGQIAEVEREAKTLSADSGHADLAPLEQALADAEAAVKAADAAQLAAEAAGSAARQALDVARRPLGDSERRLNRFDTEVKTMRKVLDVGNRMFAPVVEALSVAKGYEAALAAALGDDLDAPIDSRAPARWAGAARLPDDPALPEGVEPLEAHVEGPPELARRLAQIGVVARADGPRLQKLLQPGQRLVSREGDLWRWDGYAASANAPTPAARRLAEKNRLADVERELALARVDVEMKRQAMREADLQARTAADGELTARDKFRRVVRARDEARDRLSDAEKRTRAAATRLSALEEAKLRLAASRDEALAMRREWQSTLEGMGPTAALEQALADIRTEVAESRAAYAEARAGADALAREATARDRRLAAITEERAQWITRRDGAGGRMADIARRTAEAEAEQEALDGVPAALAAERRALTARIAEAATLRRDAADRLALGERALADADRTARAANDALSKAREGVARLEERFEAAKRRRDDLVREIAEALDAGPEEAARLAALDPAAPRPREKEVAEALDRLKRERDKLGGVNLRADEELTEVETAHTTLITERDDLIEAIKRLRGGIGQLNREARERLMASFDVVNGHFKNLYTKLFGGGVADLILVESDDPLEAGLDILAEPPGKKPQTLSLLSGGEQALTAMALIFAVFLTNPAPICVLDEVDAPLDDANVERFCDLLDEMTRLTATRFLTITHNPITMSRMDRLYGVTMAERGVSQLVSVDLQTAERIREAA